MNLIRNITLTFKLLTLSVIFQSTVTFLALLISFATNGKETPVKDTTLQWQISAGIASFAATQPWHKVDTQLAAVPYIKASYGPWSFGIDNLVSYQFNQSANFSSSIGLTLRANGYDSDASVFAQTSTHPVYNGYDAPDIELAAKYQLTWRWLSLSVEQDMSNQSNSQLASLALKMPLYDDQRGFSLTAIAAIDWLSKNYVNYYYGIDNNQTDNTVGRYYYQTESAENTLLALQLTYPLTHKWLLIGHMSYSKFDDIIYSSPLIAQDYISSAMLAVLYRF
ncbi:structural protein MipA [Thalassotalea insulae]|uniref:Structural protein MipA n=1 Tax=Thalassotalea insulae TaxID=2056778 RepID=A0ABQ6GTF0_9GAMM|nr:MipA/OmpV family protein [Thalassotalea insulae]GLX79226.1 structural protein MipA [Thalassotalea insulae]